MKATPRTLAGLLLLLVLLSACSTGTASSGSSARADGSAAETRPLSGTSGTLAVTKAGAPAREPGRQPNGQDQSPVQPMSRTVISTGQVILHSREVAEARAEVLRLVASWGGTVADEQTQGDRRGRITDSVMTLRVPSARFDAAMAGLAEVGQVQEQSRTADDVTTRVIDTRARVQAAERSVQAVERLLTRATRLSDVIAIESDLGRRRADLDSLRRQQAWLADQTSLSTITVHLSRAVPPVRHVTRARGFFAGLGHGWAAMQETTVALTTFVGAVLPFALVVLAVGWPAWVVVRRRRPGTPPAQA
jgi:hypothetical protein